MSDLPDVDEMKIQTNLLGAALYTYATDEREKAFEGGNGTRDCIQRAKKAGVRVLDVMKGEV